jgi:TonB family protein
VFVGTALSEPAWREDGRRILDFALADQATLRYRVSDCGNQADCDRAVGHLVQLVHRDFGWSLQRDEAELPPTPPRVLSRTPPRYPPLAMARRHQGQVLLQVEIGQDGRPGEVRVARSSGYQELDQAAVAAARQWRFRPASRNGRPVATRARVPVNFVLDRS